VRTSRDRRSNGPARPVLALGTFVLALLTALTLTTYVATGADAVGTPVAHGSVGQVWATSLAPHATATLLDGQGRTVARKRVDGLGGVLFRTVAPGSGYRLRVGGATSARVTVHSAASKPWDPSVYDQTIPDSGYGYLTTRDGTKLAYAVHLPTAPATLGVGLPDDIEKQIPNLGLPSTPPYPTLIEYSGYGYSDPKGPVSGIAVIANLMGFAVVDVNMRGTGCSGGAFDFFEPLQSLDGYDVIETIARQPWVKDHEVGMMGISYGGISQLFTAQTRPPSLAAIAPMSVLDATATTLYPGGILNTGFAVAWAKERQQQAQPAGVGLAGTQPYAEKRIADGDATCKANQALHGQAADLMAKIRANSHYEPLVADPLDPITFVHKIDVPVFLTCQWEDEQTGGHCPALVPHFTGTTKKWFTFTNGAHIDSLDPATLNRWFDFLSIYVAHEAPVLEQALIRVAAPILYQQAMGIPSNDPLTLPGDPIQTTGSYAEAKTAFERLPSVRVLFDNGAGTPPFGPQTPGDPYAAYEHSFRTLPVPGTTASTWYLGSHGRLLARPSGRSVVNRYVANPRQRELGDFDAGTEGGGLWGNASQWKWDWRQERHGHAVSWVSAPLTRNVTAIGAGSVVAWVRASRKDVDFQATISEVRPDGHETFVQNGWLRGSERKLATGTGNMLRQRSTLLAPVLSMRAKDARPLPRTTYTKIVIPLYYQGHAYRKGSRVRVTITAPNGTQPIWSTTEPRPATGTATVWVSSSPKHPSRLVLPVVPGLSIPTGYPPCPSLRNEPCRPYVPFADLGG
jgi:predicted acyl esterase